MTLSCPRCNASIPGDGLAPGAPVTCPQCRKPVTATVPSPEEAPADALEWLEDTFERMSRGIVRFIFSVLPNKIAEFLRDALPWLVKLVRVGAFCAVWLGLLLWPILMAKLCGDAAHSNFFFHPIYSLFAPSWVILAAAGSVWGLVRLRRRRRREREARLAQQRPAPSRPVANSLPLQRGTVFTIEDQLKTLAELHGDGSLSAIEYAARKEQLLRGI